MSTDLTELTDFSSTPNVSNVFVQVLVLGLKVSMSAGFQVSSFRISMFMLLSKKHRNTKARKLSHFQVSCFRISRFLTYEFPGFGVLLHLLPRVVGVWRRLVHHLFIGEAGSYICVFFYTFIWSDDPRQFHLFIYLIWWSVKQPAFEQRPLSHLCSPYTRSLPQLPGRFISVWIFQFCVVLHIYIGTVPSYLYHISISLF